MVVTNILFDTSDEHRPVGLCVGSVHKDSAMLQHRTVSVDDGSHKGIQQRCSRCDEHSIRLVWYMAVPRVKCDALIGMRDGLAT